MSDAAEVLATDDRVFHGFVEKAANLTKTLEVTTLNWYWKMGELFTDFEKAMTNDTMPGRKADHLASQLADLGYPIGVSTLYLAKKTFETLREDKLAESVAKGMTISFFKLFWTLSGEHRAAVESEILGPDGKAISVRALQQLIEEKRREVITANNERAADHVAKVKAAPIGGAESDLQPSLEETETVDSPDTTTTPAAPDAAAPKGNEDGQTGSRGATAQKSFSVSPLKAVKEAEKAATKSTASVADALIAVVEATKVGFDSDKAQENFRREVGNLKAALQEAIPSLQGLLKEILGCEDGI